MALSTTLISATSQGSAQAVYQSTVTGSQVGNAITSMIICNTHASTSTDVTVYAVPNNSGSYGAASASNMIIKALTLPAGETVSLDQEKLVLGDHDQVMAFASVTNILAFTISTLPV